MLDVLKEAIEEVKQGNLSAEDISFDNTGSELSSTNVQEAIEEIQEEFGSISIKDSFKVTTHSFNITGHNDVSGTRSFSEAGYYPLGVVGYSNSNSTWFTVMTLQLTNLNNGSTTLSYKVHSGDNTVDRTTTLGLNILWVKI